MPIPDGMKEAIKILAIHERNRSDELHGPFNSPHEAYGVIVEERNEAIHFVKGIITCVKDIEGQLQKGYAPPEWYYALFEDAVGAACELIQVAAMGLKGKAMAERMGMDDAQ